MTMLIVDGPNIMMRALHAAQGTGMSSADGVATGALVIFVNTLSKHIREEQPSHVVVVWEGHEGSASRKARLPSYKANRVKFDQSLQDVGFDLAELFLACCDIPSRSRPGYEADDLIGAYWAHATPHHVDKIVVLSSDKDMLQLVGPNPRGVPTEQVRVSSYGTETDRWDVERVTSHYNGIPPHALASLMAIMGDASDGIEGVPGLGPKKGAKLLLEHDLSLVHSFAEGTKHAEYRERVLINYDLINLRSLDLYEMPPRPFVVPQEGGIRWRALMDFCERYSLAQIRDRLVTGVLWRPGQDVPVGRRFTLPPAQTTVQPT